MLKLPEDKNKPLRLFYSDWKKTMEFIQDQFHFYSKFYTNGFVDPSEILVTNQRDSILQVDPFPSGILFNGKFYSSKKSIEFDVNGQVESFPSGIYVFYIEIEEITKNVPYSLDPFQSVHQYTAFEYKLSLESANNLTFNLNKLFLSFIYIEKAHRISRITTHEYPLPAVRQKTKNQFTYQVGDIVLTTPYEFHKGVLQCDGRSLIVKDYPILYKKISNSYGITFFSRDDEIEITLQYTFANGVHIQFHSDLDITTLESYPYFSLELSKKDNVYYSFYIKDKIKDKTYNIESLGTTEEILDLFNSYFVNHNYDGITVSFIPLNKKYTLFYPRFFDIPSIQIQSSKGMRLNTGIVTDDIIKQDKYFELS